MLKNLFILAALFACVATGNYIVTWNDPAETNPEPLSTSRPLLGQRMCTRGPAYWCHNITQAKECHAVKHCIKKVWVDTKLPEDNDSVCQVCKEMVKEARDQLLSNETQDEIRQVFEGSCNLIPLKIVAKECCELADQFIPELVDTLASRMDPQVVCAVSGLCNSVRIDEMLGEMKETTSNKQQQKFDLSTDTCSKCNYFLGKGVDYVKKMQKTDLKHKMLDACGHLGSYSDSCRGAVTEEFESIYSHIQNKTNAEEMCELLGLCTVPSLHRVAIGGPSNSVRVWTPPQNINDDDLPCDFCKQLVDYARKWLVANTTKEEFQQIIDGLCKQTGKFQDECLNLAKQYGEPLYQLLVDEMDPEEVCKRIGVCIKNLPKNYYSILNENSPISTILVAESKETDANDGMPMLKLVPGDRFAGDDELDPTKSSAACEFCEYALHSLQNYLDSPATEQNIKDAVNKLCNEILPQDLIDQCVDFVNDYGDALVVLLSQQIDPSQVCPKLRICTSDPMIPIPTPELKRPSTKVADLPTCPICHFAVAKLIDMIGKNLTKEAIDSAMEDVCYVLPRRVRVNCLSFMENYGDRIAEMLLIEGTSHEICAALHLCLFSDETSAETSLTKITIESPLPYERYMPSTVVNAQLSQMHYEVPRTTSENTTVNDKQGCILCEFVLSRLDTMLQNNATEEEIKETVEQICTYLPRSIRDSCQTFIDEYGNMIITYLAQSLDPAQVCAELKLCNNVEVSETLKNALQDLKLDPCELCIVVADYLAAMLEDPNVETSIDKVIEKICPVIPPKYQSDCKTLIEDYGPYLMSLLAQQADKGKACSSINICPESSTTV